MISKSSMDGAHCDDEAGFLMNESEDPGEDWRLEELPPSTSSSTSSSLEVSSTGKLTSDNDITHQH